MLSPIRGCFNCSFPFKTNFNQKKKSKKGKKLQPFQVLTTFLAGFFNSFFVTIMRSLFWVSRQRLPKSLPPLPQPFHLCACRTAAPHKARAEMAQVEPSSSSQHQAVSSARPWDQFPARGGSWTPTTPASPPHSYTACCSWC